MKFRRAHILPAIASLIVLFGTIHSVQHELAQYDVHQEMHHDAHHENHHDDNCLLADISGGEAEIAADLATAPNTKPQAQRLFPAPETTPFRTTYARGPPTRL